METLFELLKDYVHPQCLVLTVFMLVGVGWLANKNKQERQQVTELSAKYDSLVEKYHALLQKILEAEQRFNERILDRIGD